MRRTALAFLFGLGALLAAPAVDAARLTSTKVTESAQLPRVRPDFPVPAEPNQMLYLQRSSNANTVIYAARFDASGNLDARNPTKVYWRRYNTTGERKPLKFIEARLAYGVTVTRRKTPGEFNVSLKPAPQLPMLLRQTGPGKAELLATIGGRQAHPVYVYLDIDESGMIPRVLSLTLFGTDVATGRAISETFAVSGGAIRQ